MDLRPHMQWLVEVGAYMGEVSSLLASHLVEKIPMSAEADAAAQQMAALKSDLSSLAAELQSAMTTHTATADDASANKQALLAANAEIIQLRAQVAAIRAVLQPDAAPAVTVTTTADPATGTATTTTAAATAGNGA